MVNIQTMEGGLRTRGCFKDSAADKPLITVVTAVLNGERYLEQTILSVLGQSYGNVEYLIIDGGSSDGTLDIIKKYDARIDYWRSEADSGIYEAMNKGIDLARGDLIGLLNADDYYELNALQRVTDSYKSAGSPAILYTNNYVLQEDLHLKYKSYPHMRYWLGMPLCHQAMFVAKEIYRQIGSYSLNYRFAADYEFLLRSIHNGVAYVHLDEFLVNYRDTGLTSMNYTQSLAEGRKINATYFPAVSRFHAGFLLSYYKTLTLFWLQKVIAVLFGRAVLQKARTVYLKKFIAKEYEWL